MSHEIYYTSAPEGARPGQRGFCTVATSAGIPRPLWDRLESLSGYRHHFTGPATASRNPVACAHWLIQLQGRDVNVLSRVCDAGFDYTQRTNAFAHHLALEPAERAAAGPAWMLSQHGVMAERWDGQVGAIARPRPLPTGDVRPSPAAAWGRITGDAGWAGVLAEAGIKQPRRPVCILFSAEQEVFPLIAEVIALIPAPRRWDITFSTYFTGLPGNTVCSWRCCLAGTPAAAEAVRHATGGLVIDLTHPERLGAPPAGEWVDMARSGRAAVEATPAQTNWMRIRKTGDRTATRRPQGSSDISPETEDISEPTEAMLAALEPVNSSAEVTGVARGVDTSWVEQRARSRRKTLLALSALALVFVAAGVYLQLAARQATTPPPSAPVPGETTPPDQQASNATDPPDSTPSTTVVHDVPAPASHREVTPATLPAQQSVPVPPTPVVVAPPGPIVLPTDLSPPAASGAALRDPVLTVAIAAKEFDDAKAIASFRVMLPGQARAYVYKQADLAGTLVVETSPRGSMREVVTWRDTPSQSPPVELAVLAFEPPKAAGGNGKLEVTWRTAGLLRRPEVSILARAVLQQSQLVISDAAGLRPQSMTFTAPAPLSLDLTRISSLPSLVAMPAGATLHPERELPGGWTSAWKREPGSQAGGRGAQGGAGVLSFERSAGGEGPRVVVQVAPGWGSATSNWTEQVQAANAVMVKAQAEVVAGDQDVARVKKYEQDVLEAFEKEFDASRAQLKLSNEALLAKNTTRPLAQQRFAAAKAALEKTKARTEAAVQEAVAHRDAAEAARVSAAAAVAALDHLHDVDLVVELPDHLKVATLRLKLGKP